MTTREAREAVRAGADSAAGFTGVFEVRYTRLGGGRVQRTTYTGDGGIISRRVFRLRPAISAQG